MENVSAAKTPGGNFRWVICGLLLCSVSVNYVDRLVLGILKRPLCQELGWTDTDYGLIAAAFSFAYAFGYLLGGRAMDRIGVKRGLPIFVTLWSIAAIAHGFCGLIDVTEKFRLTYPWFSKAEKGIVWMTLVVPMTAVGFAAVRVALGLTEGGNFPGAVRTVAEWFPVRQRALAAGVFNSGTNVGAFLCPLIVPWLFAKFGWQTTFYVTGGIGLIWVVAWLLLYDHPEKHPRVSEEERRFILDGGGAARLAPPVPWRKLFTYRATWAYMTASVLAGPITGFYQSFLPDFLGRRFSLSLQEVGWWMGGFSLLAGTGGLTGGWISGKLLSRGWTLNRARKTALLLCALAALPVSLAPFAPTVWLTVLIVGFAGAGNQGWYANLYTFASDNMPRQLISSVVGLGGFTAYFTGGFINGFTGYLVQTTGSYVPVFAYFSGTYLMSLLVMHMLVPRITGTPPAPPAS